MNKAVFIVGTDTGIGKTFVAAEMMRILELEDTKICFYKPIQSGRDEQTGLTDIEFVKKQSDTKQHIEDMNSYCFRESIAPHLAAKREKIFIDIQLILDKYEQLKKQSDYLIIEGAGGIIVPVTEGYYMYDLIRDMDVRVIVVADAGIGTINHTCLTIDFLKKRGISISGIVINNYNKTFYEDDNIKMIEQFTNEKVKGMMKHDGTLDKDTVLDLFEL